MIKIQGYFCRTYDNRDQKDPKFKTMVEEIFGPVLTIYVYTVIGESVCKLV